MFETNELWKSSRVSLGDLIDILLAHESTRLNKTATVDDCVNWLKKNSVDVSRQTLNRWISVNDKKKAEPIYKAVLENVSYSLAADHFDIKLFNIMKFMMPDGDIVDTFRDSVPSGIYEARRFSFSQTGLLSISAFKFYREPSDAGFGYNENAYRNKFKEIVRVVEAEKESKGYQIQTQGYCFASRHGIVLFGLSFHFPLNKTAKSATLCDITRSYFTTIYIDNASDNTVLRGIIPTILRKTQNPAAAVIEMTQKPELSNEDWQRFEEGVPDSGFIPVGLQKQVDDDWLERLSPEGQNICGENKMMVVKI